jgi:hypothetical protein
VSTSRRSLLALALVALVAPMMTSAPAAAGAALPAGVRIAVSADACPSTPQVHDSLEARLPGVVREAGGALPVLALRLAAEEPPGVGLGISLVDPAGRVLLERTLQRPDTVRARDAACEALADTAALIVVRFLREVGYESPPVRPPDPSPPRAVRAIAAPPPASPPRPWHVFLGVGTAGRLGFGGSMRDPRPELSANLSAAAGRLAATLAGGIAGEQLASVPGTASARLRLREHPLRALLGARFGVAGGALHAAAGLGANELVYSSEGLAGAVDDVAVELGGEGGCWYTRRIAGPLAFRVGLSGGLVAAPRDFDAGQLEPVYRTARGYLRGELGLGLLFGSP